jgi:hypothetical protein
VKDDIEGECEVVMVLNVKTVVFWVLTTCGLVETECKTFFQNIGKFLFTTWHYVPKTALFITHKTDTYISIVSLLVRHSVLEAGCADIIG